MDLRGFILNFDVCVSCNLEEINMFNPSIQGTVAQDFLFIERWMNEIKIIATSKFEKQL